MLYRQVLETLDGGVMSVRPEHIVAGNQQAILALLWAAAVKFQVFPLNCSCIACQVHPSPTV